MLETSKDILYLVIALSVFLLTLFMCWTIYYVAMILREAKRMIVDFRKKIELVESVLRAAKEKLERSSGYMKLLVDGVTTMTDFLRVRKEKGEGKRVKRK